MTSRPSRTSPKSPANASPAARPASRRIRKVLVANRGEIAVRVFRTLREMGIPSVAVFSDVDRDAPHVFAADEAHRIGPAPAPESYLDANRVLEAARLAGADAIHPGYGFLAESAVFAQAVEDAGLTWIGPTPEATRAMGDKVRARELAIREQVPVLPGTPGPVADPAELRRAAEEIGYPVVLKAAAGGGGKGMRRVNQPSEFEQAVRLTQGEARSAFGDDRVYLERWLEKPRHIEVQILGDTHGTVLAMGERDCSIQRRHQKLVEETPSPALDDAKRRELWALAVRVARAGGYTNAGTAEFLMDREGRFYFLEMNARLQVEHPVTEMVLGIDLVREQIRVARGEALGYGQDDITPRGASIEFRVYAEDPDRGYLPDAGTVRRLELPAGPGVRVDFGVRAGGMVPVYYDPLIGKIIVWAPTRPEAVDRARRALSECALEGVRTTLPLHRWLLRQEPFVSGDYDTAYLTHAFRRAEPDQEDGALVEDAAIAAVFAQMDGAGFRRPMTESAAASGHAGPAAAGSPGFAKTSRWRTALPGLRSGGAGGRR